MKKVIFSRWNSKCAETGKQIKKGESMLYDYSSKKCYCQSSNEFINFDSDPAASMVTANEDAYFDNWYQNNY
jgi:hypothetical protein